MVLLIVWADRGDGRSNVGGGWRLLKLLLLVVLWRLWLLGEQWLLCLMIRMIMVVVVVGGRPDIRRQKTRAGEIHGRNGRRIHECIVLLSSSVDIPGRCTCVVWAIRVGYRRRGTVVRVLIRSSVGWWGV